MLELSIFALVLPPSDDAVARRTTERGGGDRPKAVRVDFVSVDHQGSSAPTASGGAGDGRQAAVDVPAELVLR
jgi:hypothetical protein